MDAEVQPDRAQVYHRSRRRWERVRQQAEERWLGPDLPDSLFDVVSLLHRIPALPSQLPAEESVMGFATWKNMDPGCSLIERQGQPHHVSLKHRGTRCRRSTLGAFDQWGQCSNNGLAMLILGWAYVFNASLVERQGRRLSFMLLSRYAHKTGTNVPQEREPPLSIRLQRSSADERAWWAALIRRGGVFKVAADKGQRGYLPWSIIVEEDWNVQVIDAASIPKALPTAEQAAQYIHRFTATFGLGNQATAALCAALTIPFQLRHNFQDCVVKLPPLSLASPSLAYSAEKVALPHDTPLEFQQLSYLMTLSTSSFVVDCMLQSVFWEPNVTSRLSGASILGMRHALAPLLDGQDYVALAKVLSFTDAGPLWLGSLLCEHGELMSLVLDKFGTSMCQVAEITAWTGIVMSFLQAQPVGPEVTAIDDESDSCAPVSRADVWRLRHECADVYEGDDVARFRRGPSHGWGPDGEMRLKDVDLELRSHLLCHHSWSYKHWTWSCSGAIDPGFRPSSDASHWLQRDDPGLSQATITARDDVITLDEENERTMDLFGDIARLRLVHWCQEHVEGDWLADLKVRGKLMKPDLGDPPDESAPSELSPGKREFVVKWRKEVILSEC